MTETQERTVAQSQVGPRIRWLMVAQAAIGGLIGAAIGRGIAADPTVTYCLVVGGTAAGVFLGFIPVGLLLFALGTAAYAVIADTFLNRGGGIFATLGVVTQTAWAAAICTPLLSLWLGSQLLTALRRREAPRWLRHDYPLTMVAAAGLFIAFLAVCFLAGFLGAAPPISMILTAIILLPAGGVILILEAGRLGRRRRARTTSQAPSETAS